LQPKLLCSPTLFLTISHTNFQDEFITREADMRKFLLALLVGGTVTGFSSIAQAHVAGSPYPPPTFYRPADPVPRPIYTAPTMQEQRFWQAQREAELRQQAWRRHEWFEHERREREWRERRRWHDDDRRRWERD
jgi:hypothetical protein